VNTGVSPDRFGHFADFEIERDLFEWLLHLTPGEKSQIAAFVSRAAVTVLSGQLFKRGFLVDDFLLKCWLKAKASKITKYFQNMLKKVTFKFVESLVFA
jgi:hypothetical protein